MSPKLDESDKFEKQRQAWKKTRQRGKQSFALINGSLGWGGFMFVFMTGVRVFVEHKRLHWLWVLTSVVLWPFAGYFWGLWMWHWFEGRYHCPTTKPPTIIAN